MGTAAAVPVTDLTPGDGAAGPVWRRAGNSLLDSPMGRVPVPRWRGRSPAHRYETLSCREPRGAESGPRRGCGHPLVSSPLLSSPIAGVSHPCSGTISAISPQSPQTISQALSARGLATRDIITVKYHALISAGPQVGSQVRHLDREL